MSSGRIIYFSRLKALACTAVVLLHTFFAAAAFAKTAGQQAAALSVRNCMMFAVPVFVMVSGALLLDKQRELGYKKLFSRLILRMVIALLVFSLVFSLFDAVAVAESFKPDSVWEGFKTALFGGGWKHMWYLYLMIAIYLLLPAYRLITKSAGKGDMIYLLAVYGVFLAVLPTVESLTGKDIAFYICAYSVYPLYLFLGYAMHNGIIRIPVKLAAALTAAGLVITVLLTVYGAHRDTQFNALLGNYSFVLFVITAAGIFGLMQAGGGREHKLLDRVCTELEQCSFGIYLIHMLFLKIVFVVWKFDPFAHGGIVTAAAVSLGVLAVSYITVRLLRFVPYINRII